MEEPRAGCCQLGMGALQLPPPHRPHGAKAPEQEIGPCNQPWGLQPPLYPHLAMGLQEGLELPHNLT